MSKSGSRYICTCGFVTNDWTEFNRHECEKKDMIRSIVESEGSIEDKTAKLWELIPCNGEGKR